MNDVIAEKARKLKLLILDVDGVLTDGKLFFDHQGNEYKAFHARDGHGIKLLRKTGVEVAVISGRKSPSVEIRMQSLGVNLIYQGFDDKRSAFNEIITRLQLDPEQTGYIGDDLLDLPLIVRAGLAIAVKDAVEEVKRYAHLTTQLPGGNGAVREVCDLIMRAQGHFQALVDDYLL